MLKDFDSVSQTLQKDDTTNCDVRVLFNTILDLYPIREGQLSPTASIILDKEAESAVFKIQPGQIA